MTLGHQVSAKLRATHEGFEHWCPGCRLLHLFVTKNNGPWTYDGQKDAPTFQPEKRIVWGNPEDYHRGLWGCCHYTLKEGIIYFLDDCTHELVGKTVPLPNLPYQYWEIDMLPASLIPPIDP